MDKLYIDMDPWQKRALDVLKWCSAARMLL